MSDTNKPATLSQYFEPPEGYVGHFGWVCGYSADASFMNTALERFTGQTESQRAWEGKIKLILMLDGGNHQITTTQVPGLTHLPVLNGSRKYNLMHAKVALLKFKKADQWAIRLVVSTGNWTRQTAEKSLDLAWSETIYSKDLEGGEVFQLASDIGAANGLLNWLLDFYSTSLLEMSDQFIKDISSFKEKLNIVESKKSGTPRFVHTLHKSLLDQLVPTIKAHTGSISRNSISIGSGFYESVSDSNKVPKAIEQIIVKLKTEKLLTSEPYKEIFVNPSSCQGVSTSFEALIDDGYSIYRSIAPSKIFGENSDRTLHAKFILGYSHRDNSKKLNNAWVYLGSGNITGPGFLRSAESNGNVEAGIIDRLDGCVLEGEGGHLITDLLPIQWGSKVEELEGLSFGSEMEEREAEFISSPVEYVVFDLNKRVLTLPNHDASLNISILDPMTNEALGFSDGCFLWLNEDVPRSVSIEWIAENENMISVIPVVDSLGRIAATELPELRITDAWLQLASFPMPPDDMADDSESTGEMEWSAIGKKPKFSDDAIDAYPIRKMMEIIENIADKQTKLTELDWELWCERLKQSLIQAKSAPIVELFRSWELNPISALYEVPFRPSFAEDNTSSMGILYESVLDTVSEEWGVDNMIGFQGIGESP